MRGTLHWVSAAHAVDAEVRLFDHLLLGEGEVEEDVDLGSRLNPNSLEVLTGCKLEPGLAQAGPGAFYQFLRHGYFCVDSADSAPGAPVFNRSVSLRDTWAKIEKGQSQG